MSSPPAPPWARRRERSAPAAPDDEPPVPSAVKGGNAKPNGWVDIGLVANVHDTDIATLVATHHLVA